VAGGKEKDHEASRDPRVEAASLLVSQAHAFTQSEEARFVAAQSRAATLLGIAGVIAGIGAGVLTILTDRDFTAPAIELIGLGAGSFAAMFLFWAVFLSIGVLQQTPGDESNPVRPVEIFDEQIAPEIDGSPDPIEIARALLGLARGARHEARQASDDADSAFAEAGRRLVLSIALGLVFAATAFFGTKPKPEQVFLGAKSSLPQLTALRSNNGETAGKRHPR
jgi:hypothetical protein